MAKSLSRLKPTKFVCVLVPFRGLELLAMSFSSWREECSRLGARLLTIAARDKGRSYLKQTIWLFREIAELIPET